MQRMRHPRPTALAAPARPVGPEPTFAAVGLSKSYPTPAGPVAVLRDATFAIPAGMVGIVGPSGSGKSTVLNLLGGLDAPTAGRLFCRGAAVPFGDAEALRRYRLLAVCPVFQELNLLAHLTGAENAALPLLCHGDGWAEARAAAAVWLGRLGVGELADRRPAAMSRGQQQRIAIARALVSPAPAILADEPTGALDVASAEAAFAAFLAAARTAGKSVVLVTHNLDLARRCDLVLECRGGTLVPWTP